MKIKWTALLKDTIATMKVWESWYVYIVEAIIVTIKWELFINLDAEVLPTNDFENEAWEMAATADTLKIKRTSKDTEGYEINLEDQCVTFIPRVEPIDNLFPEFESWIWPYKVKIAKATSEALLRTLSIENLEKVLKTFEENEDYKTMAIIKKIIEDKKNNKGEK